MQSSLKIDITGDSSKLRADLELAKAALRDLQRAYRDLSTEASRTNDRTKLDAATPQLRAAEQAVVSLTRQMRQFGREGADATHKVELGVFRLAGELTQTTQKMQFLSDAAGSLKGGLAGLLALEAGRKLFEGFSAVIDPMNEARKTAAGLRLDPNVIKAYGAALEAAGLQSSDAASSLGSFGNAVLDAQKDVATLRNTTAPAVAVMKGAQGAVDGFTSSVVTMRAGVRNVSSAVITMRADVTEGLNPVGDAMERIGIGKAAFKNDPVGRLQAIADRVVALGKDIDLVAQRDIMKFLNIDDAERFAAAMQRIHDFPLKAEAAKLPPTTEDDKRLAAYNQSVAALGNEWTKTKELAGAAFVLPTAETALLAFRLFMTDLKTAWSGIGTAAKDAWNAASQAFTDAGFLARSQQELDAMQKAWVAFGTYLIDNVWTLLPPAWQAMLAQLGTNASDNIATLKSTFGTLFSWLSDNLSSLSNSLGTLFDNAAIAGGSSVGGMATGGMVRGPGSGTSDSILARISNGEFVMRAAAVDHWGPRFMASLNGLRNPFAGLAAGGLVGDGVPRFAAGGLVSAGGTAVHLHLGGHSFALTGDRAIVDGLVRESRRTGMLSAGRAPVRF